MVTRWGDYAIFRLLESRCDYIAQYSFIVYATCTSAYSPCAKTNTTDSHTMFAEPQKISDLNVLYFDLWLLEHKNKPPANIILRMDIISFIQIIGHECTDPGMLLYYNLPQSVSQLKHYLTHVFFLSYTLQGVCVADWMLHTIMKVLDSALNLDPSKRACCIPTSWT